MTLEVVFEARDAEEGGYRALALGYSIFTQGDTWAELEAMIEDATELCFEGEDQVPNIRLIYERNTDA